MNPEPSTIRWVWGYDVAGQRCTEPEALAFVWCENCGRAHPDPQAARVVSFAPRKGRERALIAGLESSEFFPEDDDGAL